MAVHDSRRLRVTSLWGACGELSRLVIWLLNVAQV